MVTTTTTPDARSHMAAVRRTFSALLPLVFLLACMLPNGGCTCGPDLPIITPRPLLVCRPHAASRPTKPSTAPGATTVSAGTIPGTFSITSTGEASYVMPLVTVPGRAGVEPQLALTYDSSGGDGILGESFSLAGLSAITRCPSNLAQDHEIRAVRYDASDKLCLDGNRLVVVRQEPGILEFRTFPDTFTKILGHYAEGQEDPASALSFEVFTPSGLVIDYGTSAASKPLARGGVPRAWLAEKAHDGRGNAMTYSYCFADDAEGYTAEYALDEIRHTSFDGSPALAPSRAVKLVYGTKAPDDIRTLYSGGMALQSSLRL
jgi:hypothetical protein